jgi:orotidine-5'-phosphate decarboxylase
MTEGFRDRILFSAERKQSRVVLALDISGAFDTRRRRAMQVLRTVRDGVSAVKVNHHLLLPFGLEGLKDVISTCRDDGLPLIADLKLNDIESTNLNVADSLLAYGFDAVVANPFVGREEGLGQMVKEMHGRGGGVLFLVYMSHRGAREGYAVRTQGGEPLYRVFARRAREWGADGVIVSAKSPRIIEETRRAIGKGCLILSPGVGAQGATVETAKGADFIIVGRSIMEASDPAEALRKLERRQAEY